MVKEQNLAWPVGQVDKNWRAEATQKGSGRKSRAGRGGIYKLVTPRQHLKGASGGWMPGG
jgi:hypothetical protein